MFVHLHLHSPFSLMDGASDMEEIVRTAAGLGMAALALTDHDTLAGAVRFTTACRDYEIKPILGAEVTLEDETHLTLLAEKPDGYANIGRLLTRAYAAGGRLTPRLPWGDLASHAE